MSKLVWDQSGEKLFETGVKNCALYVVDSNGAYSNGVAWNGITAITESPSGAEPTDLYADDAKYVTLVSAETFGATIEAYTYPDEFAQCDGSAELTDGVVIGQQSRKVFGLAYKTTIGNDTDGNSHGYKIHLIYGALAKPSERAYSTINDSPEAITFSWELASTPVNATGFKPTSCIVIDSTQFTETAAAARLAAFEETLFGRDASGAGVTPAVTAIVPSLPLPDAVKSALQAPAAG